MPARWYVKMNMFTEIQMWTKLFHRGTRKFKKTFVGLIYFHQFITNKLHKEAETSTTI
jgi:hypothetical protein